MFKVLSNLKCNGKRYKDGDVADFRLKENQIDQLIRDGVIETDNKKAKGTDDVEKTKDSGDGLEEMTKKQLVNIAKKEKIEIDGKETNKILIEMIRKNETENNDDADNL